MAGGYPGGGKSNAVLERPQTSFRVGKAQKASSSSQLFCFFLSSQSRTDLVIAPLSGASGKFRPPLVAVQYRTACGADVAVFSPTHKDACAHSSRPLLFAPLQRSLARFRSVAL